MLCKKVKKVNVRTCGEDAVEASEMAGTASSGLELERVGGAHVLVPVV